MTQRKRLEGTAASWHPHPKDAPASRTPSEPPPSDLRTSNASLAPVVAPVEPLEHPFFDQAADAGPAAAASVAPELDGSSLDRFLSQPAVSARNDTPVEELYELESPESLARLRALQSAPVQARRRYLMRYVASAVGVASFIGLAALVRVALAPAHAAEAAETHSVMEARGATMAMEAPAEIAQAEPVADPPAVASAQAAPAAEASPSASAAAPADAPAADGTAPTEPDPAAARAAKQEAQHAIDKGHLHQAIDAAERSVALDPTDAEAWLILGAADQAVGRYGKARHAFSSCKEKATHGPRSECVALLR